MHVDIKGVHLDVSEKMREEINKKLHRLDFAQDMIMDLLFTISREKSYKVDVQINFRWGSAAHIHTDAFDVFEAINTLFDKMEQKVTKEKEKIQSHGGPRTP